VRPSLERLRDLMAAGAVERLYVHSPDRLARKYAYHRIFARNLRVSILEK
jgi:site-specific DNA recombinase